jgi:hypothetical protein
MRILVTGHRGNIGVPVARHLVDLGYEVVGFDRVDGADLLEVPVVVQDLQAAGASGRRDDEVGDRGRTVLGLLGLEDEVDPPVRDAGLAGLPRHSSRAARLTRPVVPGQAGDRVLQAESGGSRCPPWTIWLWFGQHPGA